MLDSKYKLVGSLTYDNKTYTNKDIKGILDLNDFKLDDNFYGGNANAIGKTGKDNVYIVLNGVKPIDIIVEEVEPKIKADKKASK